MHRTRFVLLGLVLASAANAQSKPPDAPAEIAAFDAQALYDRVVRSCVYLVSPKGGRANGVLIDADQRLVLTTAGAVADAGRVSARFPARDRDGAVVTDPMRYIDRFRAGEAIKGKVLHADGVADLAVVQLDKVPPDTPAVLLAKESAEAVTEVFWVGSAGQNAFAWVAGKVGTRT